MKINNTTHTFKANFINKNLMADINTYAEKHGYAEKYIKALKKIHSKNSNLKFDIKVFENYKGCPSVSITECRQDCYSKLSDNIKYVYRSANKMHPYKYAINTIISFSKNIAGF